jgi:hypothetical protein
MSFSFGRPSCGRALRCVWAPPLADVPFIALQHPTCGRADVADVCICVADVRWGANLWMCLALRWGAQLADVPCVAFGRPSCGRALRCVGVPKLGEAVLKSLPPSQNLFLSILHLVF